MLRSVTKKLLLLNSLVFVLLLGTLSCAFYVSVTHNIDNEAKAKLTSIMDALLSSIEPPERNEPPDPVPDVVQPNQDKLAEGLSLQWFDAKKKLAASKGSVPITTPFSGTQNFQEQSNTHMLLLTREVIRDGTLLGYLRIGMTVSDFEKYKQDLAAAIVLAMGIALLAVPWAVLFLVSQALKPVEVSLQRLSEFTGDAAHELKNPIMAIKTNAAVALKYQEGIRESDRDKLEAMLSAADQVSVTIDNLLSLAEAESHEPEHCLVYSQLDEIVTDVFAELTDQARDSGVVLIKTIDPEDINIRMRISDARTILSNLCKNAVSYSGAGSHIEVHATRNSTGVIIEVKDFGIGISEQDLPRIFDRFWRSDKVRNYKSGGNGLGLAIVKTIVERYRGSINVKSEHAKGTSFTVKIPF